LIAQIGGVGAPNSMTSLSSWYGLAREWRMRAAETRARADEMKEAEPKAIMLRIAADYEELADRLCWDEGAVTLRPTWRSCRSF